jgi:hypothetical protein
METRFFIDYSWWEQSGKDIRLNIQELCELYGGIELASAGAEEEADWVDPVTAQVHRVENSTYLFLTKCCSHPEFITERMTLTEAVFRAFLAADNRPMTPVELSERVGRPADLILKTLSGNKIYKGLRPYTASQP